MAPLPLPLTRDQSAVRRAAPRWADFNTLPAPLRLGPVALTPRSRALMDSLRLDDLEDDTTADAALPSPASIAALVGPERLMEPLHGSRRPLILPPLITFAPPPAFAPPTSVPTGALASPRVPATSHHSSPIHAFASPRAPTPSRPPTCRVDDVLPTAFWEVPRGQFNPASHPSSAAAHRRRDAPIAWWSQTRLPLRPPPPPLLPPLPPVLPPSIPLLIATSDREAGWLDPCVSPSARGTWWYLSPGELCSGAVTGSTFWLQPGSWVGMRIDGPAAIGSIVTNVEVKLSKASASRGFPAASGDLSIALLSSSGAVRGTLTNVVSASSLSDYTGRGQVGRLPGGQLTRSLAAYAHP